MRVLRWFISPAAWALLLYAAGAFALTHVAWRTPGAAWAGSCCDPQQTIWYVRWAPYAVGHLVNPFFIDQLNAPYGVNAMWNTPVFAASLLVSPITLLWGPVVAFNFLVTAAIALSGWCAYLALRRYSHGNAGPLIGGAVYGFSPYVVPQALLHLPLALAFVPPLFLLVLDELLIRRRRSPLLLGVALGVLVAVQLLTEEELVVTSALMAVVMIAVLAWRRWGEVVLLWRPVGKAITAAALTGLVLCALPLAVQFFGPQRVHGQLQDPESFSTDLLNLVVPTHHQLIAPDAAATLAGHFTGGFDFEANAYIGFPLLLLLTAFTATHWKDLRIRAAAIVAAAAFLLSLGPHLHIGGASTGWPLPFWLFTHVPLLQDIQPNRLAVLMWLAIAVLVAVAVDRALTGRFWTQMVPRLGVLGVALVAILPAGLPVTTADIPVFFQRWSDHGIPDSATVLIAPFFRDGAGAAPMLWAAVAGGGVRMPEAYAFIPAADGSPMYGPIGTTLTRTMESIQDTGVVIIVRGPVRDQVAQDLRTLGVQDVIVGPMDNRDQMIAFFTDLFGRSPRVVEGVQIWSQIQQAGVAPPPAS